MRLIQVSEKVVVKAYSENQVFLPLLDVMCAFSDGFRLVETGGG